MKTVKKFIKNNTKALIAFILGLVIAGGSFAVYAITATNITYTDNYSIGATTVQGAIDKLYASTIPYSSCSNASQLTVGTYFTMKPSLSSYTIPETGYSSTQIIDPSELTLWRVIQVGPCSVDAVSEYVSSTEVYFAGVKGYQNFVGLLNEISRAYQNPKYTSGARMMGYGGQTEYLATTTAYDGSVKKNKPSDQSTESPTSGLGQEFMGTYSTSSPGDIGDTLYLKDYILVSDVYKSDASTYGETGLKSYAVNENSTAADYWLASRYYYLYYSSPTYRYVFIGRSIDSSGNLIGGGYYTNNYFRYGYYNSSGSGASAKSISHYLRPIITLKSGVSISGGSGTKASPYTLN